MNDQEKASQAFYDYERRLRGYFFFSYPVSLEAYFTPYRPYIPHSNVDNGKGASFFEQLGSIFVPKKSASKKEEKEEELFAYEDKNELPLTSFQLIPPQTEREGFSSMLSLLSSISYHPTLSSFEIIANKERIVLCLTIVRDEATRFCSLMQSFFPRVEIEERNPYDILPFKGNLPLSIIDYGLDEECVRPIATSSHSQVDSLRSLIANMASLAEEETAMLQILFQGTVSPWKRELLYAVSDGKGGSFFADAPEMPKLAAEKTSSSLFSAVVRLAVQTKSEEANMKRAEYLSSCLSETSDSGTNKLTPLPHKGYAYESHLINLYQRKSNRLGMLLSAHELMTFVNIPPAALHEKLMAGKSKTKALPSLAKGKKYSIGTNIHKGREEKATASDESRLRHMHVTGSTGTGKSTFLLNLILEDISQGNGIAVLDPHGDLVSDILLRIPEERKEDVILIDPADTSFSVGFNILRAEGENESIQLSGDLVATFKRYASAWGDNMSSVLENAIAAFLFSHQGGTLIELKRFLVEDRFREEYMQSVDDPALHYYFQYDYPLLKKGITPLLTRIDTFLRPKIIRSMLSQKERLHIGKAIEKKKIILFKLSVGLMGKENAQLLGSLFIGTFLQSAMNRQSLSKEKRHPYYLYLDECHYFMTPSIGLLLSGARKYGLGLVLAHQELAQIDDPKLLASLLSNAFIKVCFRAGENDVKKLSTQFSFFDEDDVGNLSTGEAIVRIGKRSDVFLIHTQKLPLVKEAAKETVQFITKNTQKRYALPKEEIEHLIREQLTRKTSSKKAQVKKQDREIPKSIALAENKQPSESVNTAPSDFEEKTKAYLKEEKAREEIKLHRKLQEYVRSVALPRGFASALEYEVSGGRIDVVLKKGKDQIAIEISNTNTSDYEVQNILKCLSAGFSLVLMISENRKHLKDIQEKAKKRLPKAEQTEVSFLTPEKLPSFLDTHFPEETEIKKRVRGYRVKVKYMDS